MKNVFLVPSVDSEFTFGKNASFQLLRFNFKFRHFLSRSSSLDATRLEQNLIIADSLNEKS